MTKPLNERTCDVQRSIETGERFPISYFDSRQYVQHNLGLADGLGPILALMDALPKGRTRVTPVRSFVDGDHSVAHLDYVLGDWGPMVGFEVHRWSADRIVEHWDNLQPTPAGPNPAGRRMTDGPTEVTDLAETDANKRRVARFTAEVLVDGRLDRSAEFFRGGALIQHNPTLGDGADAFVARVRSPYGPRYARLRKLLGQGNFVLAASEGTSAGGGRAPAAFYDLYRLADGAIAEHWDVVETLPPREQWKNANGKF